MLRINTPVVPIQENNQRHGVAVYKNLAQTRTPRSVLFLLYHGQYDDLFIKEWHETLNTTINVVERLRNEFLLALEQLRTEQLLPHQPKLIRHKKIRESVNSSVSSEECLENYNLSLQKKSLL